MSDLNAYSKVDHYKSWGGLKKQLCGLLCDSLKDKITYFYTNYHKRENTNMYGRATINYEKQELVAFSWDIFFDVQFEAERKVIPNGKEKAEYYSAFEAQKAIHERLMKDEWMPAGTLCHEDFIHAAVLYLNTDVATALKSDNYLLRIFAYMDRRVGKRTLEKIRNEVEALPDWVKIFYDIRREAEGLDIRIIK